ncbi:hypothetical protein tb265_00430 [Gemmatimonadetes bacterium T265]|nr:hypothetical protein tb265_00430 [Gemmatimonadetes bacterium T265]
MPSRHPWTALWTSRNARLGVAALGLAATTLGIACADADPTAPAAARAAVAAAAPAFHPGLRASVAPTTTTVPLLLRAQPLAQDVPMTFTVQPGGTTFRGPDIAIAFEAGFVARPTTFTLTWKAGRPVAFDVQPSGTFTKPVTVTLGLGAAAVPAGAFLSALQGAYVRSWAQVSASAGTAAVDEFEPTTVDANAGTVTLTLSHFSGYMMSWGRH